MRVLMISKTFVASTAQRKLEELELSPGAALQGEGAVYCLAEHLPQLPTTFPPDGAVQLPSRGGRGGRYCRRCRYIEAQGLQRSNPRRAAARHRPADLPAQRATPAARRGRAIRTGLRWAFERGKRPAAADRGAREPA